MCIRDSINAASYVIKGLKESGHVVDHASDGEEGMELSLTLKFDVIIIDRMLPKLDGLSLIKKIKKYHLLLLMRHIVFQNGDMILDLIIETSLTL